MLVHENHARRVLQDLEFFNVLATCCLKRNLFPNPHTVIVIKGSCDFVKIMANVSKIMANVP